MAELDCPHVCPDVVWLQVLPGNSPDSFRSYCRICCLSALNVDELCRQIAVFHLGTCPGIQRELVHAALVDLRHGDAERVTVADIRAAQVIAETHTWAEVDVVPMDDEG